MSKRDEFEAFVSRLKAVSPTITDEQRKGLLRQANLEFEVPVNDAVEILRATGFVVGQNDNYFEIFEISIAEFNNLSENDITTYVDATHKKLYTSSLAAGGLPRPDGRSQEQWRNVLNQARDTLVDPLKRREHITILQHNRDEQDLEEFESISTKQVSEVDTPRQELSHDNISDDVDVPEEMVFIPAGEFQMGSDDIEAQEDEQPIHVVFLDAYLMDIYPVTNSDFRDFMDANPKWRKADINGEHISIEFQDGSYLRDWEDGTFPDGKANHPVTQVSWYAAMAYSQWVGKRLPDRSGVGKSSTWWYRGQEIPLG